MSKKTHELQKKVTGSNGFLSNAENPLKQEEAKKMIYEGTDTSTIANQVGVSEEEIEKMKDVME